MRAFRVTIAVLVALVLIAVASRGAPLAALKSIPFWAIAAGFAAFAAWAIFYLYQVGVRRRRDRRLDPDEIAARRR
jgi:membrane protein YdbS with pleckstrin-like domain